MKRAARDQRSRRDLMLPRPRARPKAWMTREPLPPHNNVFDVSEEELERIFDELD